MTEDIRAKMTEYNADAIDGDKDGFVQDGTEWERPVDEDVSVDVVAEEVTEDSKESMILADEPVPTVPALTPVADGVIGSGATKKATKKSAAKAASTNPVEEKVGVYSTRNVTWVGVGKVLQGLNIVTKSQAEKWLTRDHTRLADPKQVAEDHG
tara:strand:+ start:3532 stop:3993 length:462 start_codon:yes stop_codon:yes gene_type:complete